jgi:hypothetical protein
LVGGWVGEVFAIELVAEDEIPVARDLEADRTLLVAQIAGADVPVIVQRAAIK